jgi:PAS domain S-box-containing protein
VQQSSTPGEDTGSHRVQPRVVVRAVEAERLSQARRVNTLRFVGVSAFFALQLVFERLLDDPVWKRDLDLFGAYWIVSAVLFTLGPWSQSVARAGSIAIAVLDVPVAFLLQWSSFPHNPSERGVAHFTLAIYCLLVVLAAFSLEPKRIWVAAASAAIFANILQGLAGVELGARIAGAMLLGLVALACVYISRRVVTLVNRVVLDVNEIDWRQRALAATEASVGALMDGSPDAVLAVRDGAVVYANPRACEYLGFNRPTDLAGYDPAQLFVPEDRALVAEALGTPLAANAGRTLEARFMRLDRSVVFAELGIMVVVVRGAAAHVIVARDLTARAQLQARLIMSDRLASMGKIAASIGHEVKNPLNYVGGNVELAIMDLDQLLGDEPPEPLRAMFTRMRGFLANADEGSQRIKRIIDDMSTLARAQEEAGVANVHEVVESALNLAGGEIRSRAKIVRELAPVQQVALSPGRLGQVLLNLLVNAAQAIPRNVGGQTIRIATWQEAARIFIEITDSGSGMPPEVKARLFEPFFTTKLAGEGTGLGLPICQSIVTAAGGTISVESEPGKGSAFRLVLPAAVRATAAAG